MYPNYSMSWFVNKALQGGLKEKNITKSLKICL